MFHNKVSHRNMPEAKTALELIPKASSWNWELLEVAPVTWLDNLENGREFGMAEYITLNQNAQFSQSRLRPITPPNDIASPVLIQERTQPSNRSYWPRMNFGQRSVARRSIVPSMGVSFCSSSRF
jgi:hypothetical protein